MKNKLLFMMFLICINTFAQVKASLEQIYYFSKEGGFAMGPLLKYQGENNWYAEARYNYEEARTVSFYIGKTFSSDAAFTYEVTPIFGGIVGRFNGWSGGLNIELEFKNFYLSSQSQYSFTLEEQVDNFYFSWSELGYQPLHWLFGGLALQETYYPQKQEYLTHPGVMLGVNYKRWTLPLYGFKTGKDSQAFVCSLIYEW